MFRPNSIMCFTLTMSVSCSVGEPCHVPSMSNIYTCIRMFTKCFNLKLYTCPKTDQKVDKKGVFDKPGNTQDLRESEPEKYVN